MFPGITLALLLSATPAEVEAHRVELNHLAARIEHLKLRHMHGENVRRELERLLVRAQELAAVIESELHRGGALPLALPPSPDELRERADAARDEADRISASLHALDIRIASASNELRMSQIGASIATGTDPERHRRLRALLEQRELLARRQRAVLAEAAQLEAEARAIEGER